MKHLKIAFIVIAVCAVAWCGLRIYAKHFYNKEPQAEYFYLSEIPVKPSQFEADFEEIHQIVMENYSLYQAKHLNMDSLYQTYITRVRQAQTTTDYGLAVQEYISALQCSHAISCFRTYTARQFPVLIQDSLYINKPNAYLAQHGFKDKDCIIAISKVPYKEWINQHEKYAESSTDAWRHLKSARYAFTSYADTLRDYTLLRKGDTLTISLPLKRRDYFSDEKEVTVETKVLQDSIGYLAINTMMSPVLEDFKTAYPQIKDLPYLIIFLITAVSSIGVLGVFLAGWASNNKYSVVSAMRGAVQMISYEMSLGLCLISAVVLTGTMQVSGIVEAQTGAWNWLIIKGHVPAILAFLVFLVAGNAEANRGPFDLAEAESELTAGYHTEYSGMGFGFYYLAEYLNLFVISGIASTVFLGGWAPLNIGIEGFDNLMNLIPGFIWFFGKTFAVVWLLMWVRWTFPRLRIDQILKLEWKYLMPLSLVILILMTVCVAFGFHG